MFHQPLPERIGREASALLRLGGPVIAAQLAQISMNFVDTVMAGRLSRVDLAAVAVGGSLWMPIFVFGMGVLLAVSPTVANSFGAQRHQAVGSHVRQGLWLSQIVALWTFVAIRCCTPALEWLEVDPAVVPKAIGYLHAVSWGVPATWAYTVLRSFSEAVSRTRPLMVISVIGLISNIIGNDIFMYGRFGMPRLEGVGCGVATAIVMWIMLACLAAWILWQPYYRQFAVFSRWEWIDRREILSLLRLGAPIGVCLFMEGSMFGTVSLLMGRLGADVVAGHQVALNVASVTFMVPLGISIAITVRVGQALGAGRSQDARRSGFVGAGLAVGFMAATAVTMASFPQLIAAGYTSDPRVQEVAAGLLVMAAIFQVFDGLQVAGAGALRGLKDTAIPMFITLAAYWGLGLPLGVYLGIMQARGPQALWIGLIAGLVAAALLLNVRFYLRTSRLMAECGEEEARPVEQAAPAAVEVPVES